MVRWRGAARLQELYRRGMGLELKFFNAQRSGEAVPRPRMLLVDFDDTLTLTDTTPLIINAASEAARIRLESARPSPSCSTLSLPCAHSSACAMCAVLCV